MNLPQLVFNLISDVFTLTENVGLQIKSIKQRLGSDPLNTQAQTVNGAINELKTGQASAAGINDSGTSTTSSYSSSKVASLLLGKMDTSAPLPAFQLTGTIDPARLPTLSFMKAFNSTSATIGALSSFDQAKIVQNPTIDGTFNAVRLSGGELYIYGGGVKTDVASYILVSDSTPDFNLITNKPTTAAGYGLTDVLTTADIGNPSTDFSGAFTAALA